MAKRILVLHSGGMDSTVCLYKAKADGNEVMSLGIDYGQRLAVEALFATRQCAARDIPRQVLTVAWQKTNRHIPLDRPLEEMASTVSPAFLPGRNLVFLSLACAHAAGIGAEEVHIGLNCIDFSGYPDCTEDFFDAFRQVAAIAAPGRVTLEAPLLTKSKPAIASLAAMLGIGKSDTWSCYNPDIRPVGVAPCGRCDACRLHDYAWAGLV